MMRHRIIVLTVILVISAIALFFCFKVEFDASVDIWFLENDPDLVVYQDFLDRFDADEVTVMGVFADNIFTPENLAAIDRLTRAAEKVPFAHRVQSLTNINVAKGSEENIEIGPLIEILPETMDQAQRIKKETLTNPIIVDGLVSKDCKAAAIVIELAREGGDFESKLVFNDALEKVREGEQNPNLKILLSGTAIFDAAFYRYSNRDFTVYGPVTLLFVIFASFFVFRRFSSSIIPLLVVALSCIWTFGLMGGLGIKFNVLSSALGGLIIAVGIADTIHILADYYQELMKGHSPDEAAKISIRQLFIPCLFTSATTSAGMLALLVSDLKPVREFGWLAAFSVTVAFVISFTFVPAVLQFAKPPDPKFIDKQRNGLLSRILARLGNPTRKSSAIILSIAFIFVVGGIVSLNWLRVGSNPMNYFHKGDPVRTQTEAIDKALGGSTTIEFLIETKKEGLKEPDILKRIDRLERWLDAQVGISKTLSIVDSLKEMNRVFHGGLEENYTVPDTRPMIAQYYLLMEGEDDFDSYVQQNYSVGRITSRILSSESEELTKGVPILEKKLKTDFPDEDISIVATGLLKLMATMESYLLNGQIKSILLAFTVITLMMLVLLRSFRLALFSMIPNLTPILMGVGFMALAGISLDVGTVMIGSIAMGLVVDDSVHFLVRLRRFSKEGLMLDKSIFNTMQETGRPIIVTSIVLAAGFSVLMLGSFAPNYYFGMVSAIVILMALIFDLVVLPAALMIIRPKI